DTSPTTTSTLDETGATSAGSTAATTEPGSTTASTGDDTIYQIQDGTIGEEMMVDVRGVVVTAVYSNAVFVQEPEGGAWSGVYVFLDAKPSVDIGDEVDIVGQTQEFSDRTEIDVTAGCVTPTGTQGIVIEPETVALVDLAPGVAEPWESVLVRVEATPLSVLALVGGDEFEVGGVDAVQVDGLLYDALADGDSFPNLGVGAGFSAVVGPLNYSGGDFKIAPRRAVDLSDYVEPTTTGIDVNPGDLVVTEIMYNPTCNMDRCEWIEIYNATGANLDLLGLRIRDEMFSIEGTIDDNAIAPAGGYAVLALSTPGQWPYAEPADAHYGSGPELNNGGGGDEVYILDEAQEVIDQTANYDRFNEDDGRSWKLDPTQLTAAGNDEAGNWCFSVAPLQTSDGTREWGSPGAPNEAECFAM
ncbi:MAG: lamin tail domain-containing protein, partial [Deltaproteobacteria bacterium]|nr:lamin tail domain-containing protein [Deltaproteobacteria bacterium]